MRRLNCLVVFVCGYFLAALPGRADVVANIQFGSATSSPATQAQTGAAVVGNSGDQWNLITSFPGTTARALNNTAGSASGISMTSNTPGGSGIYRSATAFATWNGTGYQNLMSSYTNPSNSSSNKNTLTFTGLNTSTLYDIYVYTSSDVSGRRIAVDINGTQQTANASNASLTTFVLNTNYLRFSNMSFGSGTMTLQYWMAANEADMNGIQIVAVPEPGTLLLGGLAAACGGGGVWWKRRKRKTDPSALPAGETVV
jgi:hypothetical protein